MNRLTATATNTYTTANEIDHEVAGNSERPSFPIKTAEEMVQMDDKMCTDAVFRAKVVRMRSFLCRKNCLVIIIIELFKVKKIRKAHQEGSIRHLILDAALDGYTNSRRHRCTRCLGVIKADGMTTLFSKTERGNGRCAAVQMRM